MAYTSASPGAQLLADPVARQLVERFAPSALDSLLSTWVFSQPSCREVYLPAVAQWHVDVLDTRNMTVQTLTGTLTGRTRIPLPGRPYLALRFRRVGEA